MRNESDDEAHFAARRGDATELERTRPARGFLLRLLAGRVLVLEEDLRIAAATRGALEFFGIDDLTSLRSLWDEDIRPFLARRSTVEAATDDRTVVLRPAEVPVPAACVLERTRLVAGADGESLLASITRLDELDELGGLLELSDRAANLAAVHDAIVHDLRAPLNSVTLAAQLLDRALLDAAATVEHEYAVTLERELARFQRLLRVFLDAVRPPLDLERAAPIDAVSLGREVAAFVAPLADSRGVRFVITGPEASFVEPRAEEGADRLKHAVTTFTLHVLDALAPGGELTMHIVEASGRSVLRVTGSAPAIEHEEPGDLRAERVERRLPTLVDGLSVARAITTAFGGRVSDVSERAGETGFAIELPGAQRGAGENLANR